MQSRLDIFRSDALSISETTKEENKCSLSDIIVNEESISFSLQQDGKCLQFTCCVSEDYPENTFLSCSEEPSRNKVCSEPLSVILSTLIQDSHVIESKNPEIMDSGALRKTPFPGQMINQESGPSNYADYPSDLSSDNEDEYHQDEDLIDEVNSPLNPSLETDIENCRRLFGEDSLQYRLYPLIDDIDVEFHMSLSPLQEEVADAWGLRIGEPLVIRLHLSSTMYLDSATPPKVEIFQPNKPSKGGVTSQLRVITETFLCDQWKSVTNAQVERCRQSTESRTKYSMTVSDFTQIGHSSSVDDISLACLVSMGFPLSTARNALIITHGDVTEASNILISTPHRAADCLEEESVICSGGQSPVLTTTTTQTSTSRPVNSDVTKPAKKLMTFRPKFYKKRSGNMASSNTTPNLNSIYGESTDCKTVKEVPALGQGFLPQIYMYVKQRLSTLNEYCVVCDQPHVFQNGAMLKPAVCSRELCVFAYQTLGVMADATETIASGSEVVDILIAMAKAACLSPRNSLIFDPYPTVVDPKNPKELALHPKKKNFAEVGEVLRNLFSMHYMSKAAPEDLKKEMDQKDSLSYPLLQWIITSNRSHIVKLPNDRQLPFMKTPHQFLLLNSPPAKEAVFLAEKQKYGSTFAFHGSHLENWHSIVRNGLMNASGTKFQKNGAAYGKGIYLSPSANVSFGYSGINTARRAYGQTTKRKSHAPFLKGEDINCIALCEVVTSKELKKNGEIWVCPNSDHVCTRFFFLYDHFEGGQENVKTEVAEVKEQILKACGYKTFSP